MLSAVSPPDLPPPPGGWFSHAIRVAVDVGSLLYVSGQAAVDVDGTIIGPGDVGRQTEHVFGSLERILAAEGGTFTDVVHLRTYLVDMAQLAAYGAVRARFVADPPPASTTVGVTRLVRPDALVEIDLVAALPEVTRDRSRETGAVRDQHLAVCR